MAQNKKEKIEGALQLLDEAAKETKEEISEMVREKYHHLEDSVARIEPAVRKNLKKISQQASETYDEGLKVAKQKAQSLDKSIHESPWVYIAGTALAGVVVGYFLGKK